MERENLFLWHCDTWEMQGWEGKRLHNPAAQASSYELKPQHEAFEIKQVNPHRVCDDDQGEMANQLLCIFYVPLACFSSFCHSTRVVLITTSDYLEFHGATIS
jgi:hypothetical protein